MRIDVLTIFPQIFDSYMGESMMKRAQEKHLLDFTTHDLRDWTHDNHRTTDDYVYGGGDGLLCKCEPFFEALDDLIGKDEVERRVNEFKGGEQTHSSGVRVVIPSPSGRIFDDELSKDLALSDRLLFICGHYEGIDERVYCLADDVVSIGDYVLTSGELASQVIIDSVVRKIPGVLGAEAGAENESFCNYLLEHPQWTRPSEFRGLTVPDVLLTGNHKKIDEFNRHESIKRTWERRPDLIERAIRAGTFDKSDLEMFESIKQASNVK